MPSGEPLTLGGVDEEEDHRAQDAQGKTAQAADVGQHFDAVWNRADITLTTSVAR